jgi:hypothetical protein
MRLLNGGRWGVIRRGSNERIHWTWTTDRSVRVTKYRDALVRSRLTYYGEQLFISTVGPVIHERLHLLTCDTTRRHSAAKLPRSRARHAEL